MCHPNHLPVQEAAISCVAVHTLLNTNKHLQHRILFPLVITWLFISHVSSFDSILISHLTTHTHPKTPLRSPVPYSPPHSHRELLFCRSTLCLHFWEALRHLKITSFRTIHSAFILCRMKNIPGDFAGNSILRFLKNTLSSSKRTMLSCFGWDWKIKPQKLIPCRVGRSCKRVAS